ncbi:hypothetical protein OESDEN_14938, partial [Oesophagostomum dentatum]
MTAMNRVHERLQGFGTPYESYTIATLQAQKREAEQKAKEKEATESPSQTQKFYTHHDAPAQRPAAPSNVQPIEASIDLRDQEENSPSFSDAQILTKKELKRVRKEARKNVDISTELEKEEGPSYTVKRVKKEEESKEDSKAKIEAFDYSQFKEDMFNKRPTDKDESFDPFNQKYRVENKKNFRRRVLLADYEQCDVSWAIYGELMVPVLIRKEERRYGLAVPVLVSSSLVFSDIHVARREDDQMHLDVSFRQLTGDCQHHYLNNIIQATLETVLDLEMFPRTGLTVTAHLLQADGSIGATALTAIGLAVLDNGICIKAPFCGVEVCEVDGKLILDPDLRTESKADANWLFVFTRT